MQERIERQIEKMKEQTIGVEVEMNKIDREEAANLAARYFGTGQVKWTPDGYDTHSAIDGQGREWKFQRDGSIHGPENERCELVTPILKYEDLELLQGLLRVLRKAGAKSDATRGCGIHIHIGVKGHTPESLRNLANIMKSHEGLLIDALKIDERRVREYAQTVNSKFIEELNSKKPKSMKALEDIWYKTNNADINRTAHYNRSRYHMLNYHAIFTKGTIEFRLFQFDKPEDGKQNGIHAGQLKSYVQLCLALSQLAKELKTASPKPQQKENPKYAMRTWLLRLGFIGDEFKTARNFLTKRLEGNAAFRK